MYKLVIIFFLSTVCLNISAMECVTKADLKLPKMEVENFAGNFRMYAQFSNGSQIGFGLREFPVTSENLVDNEYCSFLVAYNASNGKSNYNAKESKWIYEELDLGSIELNLQQTGMIADLKSGTFVLYFDNLKTNLASNNTVVGLVCQLVNPKDTVDIAFKINKNLSHQLICK